MNTSNTKVIIARYNESIDFIQKILFEVLLYEKENSNAKYNIIKNKGNEATVYLKYIIDHYDILTDYTIFIHCHEYSWHHHGSIIDRINENINLEHTVKNLNHYCLGDMDNLDESTSDLADYFRKYIRPAVGPYILYPNFTKGELGCAQYIVHKNNILLHSKKFYEDIFDYLMNTDIDNYWSGRFLEWTWNLFWNKCSKNIPIRNYLNETITNIEFTNKELNLDNKRDEILKSLYENKYYYVNEDEINITINDNINHKCKNQYIYIKYV